MKTCDQCRESIPDGASFCPSCGAEVVSAESPTIDRGGEAPPPRRRDSGSASSDSFSHGRFLPGTLLGERYRIVAMLGRGGMGEVYRADDLKLGQPVALKFLPQQLADDPARLERFLQEVRSARQVSHPNVCRVYDVGEVDGEHFLSMEYVEGEDLAHLIRRIGALPEEKALQVARQIAAGLGAAHDKGLIHRDLKPANVMLDERGIARITDFGLAGSVDELTRGNVREGTPHYMAPEQLEGRDVSVRSDIYSLGLVLFEIFTGKRAFDAESLAKLVEMRHSATSSETLSHSMSRIDPAIQRVILRCLEEDPAKRPPSALSVSAALPGGDPLAAALAAGETPSPEMVAAGGEEGLIKPLHAIVALAIVVLGSILVVAFNKQTIDVDYSHVEYSPAVMKVKAREMLERLGYDDLPGHGAGKYYLTLGHVRHVTEVDKSPNRWDRLESPDPPLYLFWYRDARQPLVTTDFFAGLVGGYLRPDDPPVSEPGMVRVTLDPQARLTEMKVIPPARDPNLTTEPYDWAALLEEAGLDPAELEEVSPEWIPPYATSRAAWTGAYPGGDAIPFRIEAAAYGDRPIYFRKIPVWEKPPSERSTERSVAQIAQASIITGVFLLAIIGGALLARRNVLRGKGDLRGANRLALALFLLMMAIWTIAADHVASFAEMALLIVGFGKALYQVGLIWLCYLALEPWLRRRWPQTLVTWTRALHGKVNDPLVGRDVLVAFAVAIVLQATDPLIHLVNSALGAPELFWQPTTPADLGLTKRVLADVAFEPVNAALMGFIFLFVMMLFRIVLRRNWLVVIAFIIFITTMLSLGTPWGWIGWVRNAVNFGVRTIVLVRYGLVSYLAYSVCDHLIAFASEAPLAFGEWNGWSLAIVMALLWGIAIWAFRASMAGRPAFSGDLFEE